MYYLFPFFFSFGLPEKNDDPTGLLLCQTSDETWLKLRLFHPNSGIRKLRKLMQERETQPTTNTSGSHEL